MKKNARSAAFAALERCEKDKAWSAAALDAAIRENELSDRDAALASRLCLGVLQNGAFLDHYIDRFSRGRLEPGVRLILRLGAYQLLFLDKVPVHAAVSETVELCRDGQFARAASLVNAVLRRIAEIKDDPPDVAGKGTAAYLATRWSHPLWLAERLIAEKGYHFTEAFFRENNEAAPLCIQVNRLRVSEGDYLRALERNGLKVKSFPELPGCFELEGGKVTDLPGFEEGLFYVQDRAARTAVQIAGARSGMRILDVCAAPGGKSFAAALDAKADCRLISCDLLEKKLRLVRNGAERLGLSACIETIPADARQYRAEWEKAFDLVLADVPCSGLGVIRKRPEIRQKQASELTELPKIQAAVLENVSRYVKPGGLLLYSTCTVLREENRDQIEEFLARHPEFQAEDFSCGAVCSTGGCYEFWPQTDGTDGFFAAKLRRKAE
ncbi:MAG: 16S rRNA (cytosine(967)-C(5))-methyltransferase RsmB [Oscillospiraceae bacterium]|nr:16S rRNA (cytosine(967)-C(5))-methyltransferase RsmB [Oscillospiraceae bacterium]